MRSSGRSVWLWWWLGVLVAGCSQHTFSGSPSHVPTPSLLSLTQALSTPTPILRLLRTPTLRVTGLAHTASALPTPLPVSISPPTCYETPVSSLWCLGLVHNKLTAPVGQIAIRIYLVNAKGMALAEKEATLPRTMLTPGEFSPYGALFDSTPDEMVGAVAILLTASHADSRITPISVEVRDIRSEQHDSVYRVTGTLSNRTGMTLRQLAVVVTLLDASGRITGFRQWRWPPEQTLTPGALLTFELDIIPQGNGTVRAEVSAEGQRS